MWRDDEQLLAALAEAMAAARAVPDDFIQAGKDAYDWRAIDAEIAALMHDSTPGEPVPENDLMPAGTRAEPAALRALTFTSTRLTVEVQLGSDALLGQVAPPRAGEVEVQLASGPAVRVPVDPVGWFAVRPAPTTAFRLRLDTGAGADVLTSWVTP